MTASEPRMMSSIASSVATVRRARPWPRSWRWSQLHGPVRGRSAGHRRNGGRRRPGSPRSCGRRS
jgi:hypothetical protein